MTNQDLIERLKKLRARPADSLVLHSDYELLSEAIAALENRPAGVAVKKLEWKGLNSEGKIEPYGWAFAETAFGQYEISDHGDNWTHDRYTLTFARQLVGRYASDTAAFAASLADFDQRIRSALEPSPEIEAPAVGEAEAVAWRYEELYVGRGGEKSWHLRLSVEKPTEHRPDVRNVEPLYLHPAPVPSLVPVLRKARERLHEVRGWINSSVPAGTDAATTVLSRIVATLAEIDAALTGQPETGDGRS